MVKEINLLSSINLKGLNLDRTKRSLRPETISDGPRHQNHTCLWEVKRWKDDFCNRSLYNEVAGLLMFLFHCFTVSAGEQVENGKYRNIYIE